MIKNIMIIVVYHQPNKVLICHHGVAHPRFAIEEMVTRHGG